MTMGTRVIALLAVAVCCAAQNLDKPTKFHVKLSDPIGGKAGKPGARVGAVVISPEVFLGGRLEGVIRQAGGGKLEVVFTVLKYKGKSWNVTSRTTDFVNSIGHPAVDEEERPLKLVNGVLVSDQPLAMLEEGAELRLEVTPSG
ncbi:MAG: hypothetical protein HY820_31085 [Acidobacteria bacterium]|nr:hypothetical protein [Acidobacteriota bacterium]